MDIWRWVHGRMDALYEDGHEELVDYMSDITSYAVDEKFDLVDQVFNAAIPLCRALDDKWLEIFFRHWRLQAHVLKNYDAKGLLPEAISLLDFAHAEDTKNCPQRICAVQDLAACYGIKDGPGFSDERVSVCKETLAQIDGSWPCYQCVSGELIDALMDGEKFKQAEEEIQIIEDELARHDETDGTELIFTKTRLYIELGDLDKARALINDASNPLGGEGFKRDQVFIKTLVLCHQGQWEEAEKLSPTFEDALIAANYYNDWTNIQMMLVGQDLVENSRNLRQKFHLLAQNLVAKDALRVAFDIYERLVNLCISAQEKFRAEIIIRNMWTLKDGFNRDLGASEKLEALTVQVDRLSLSLDLLTFENVEALLEHEFTNENQEIQTIEAGLKTWPGHVGLLTKKSDILQACFEDDAAFKLLSNAYENHKGSAVLEDRYCAAFIKKYGFERFMSDHPMTALADLSKGAIWNRGFIYVEHFKDENPERALESLKAIEPHWPEDIWLMDQIAKMHLRLKNFEALFTYRQKQVEAEPENANHKWDLLVAATITQNTEHIRKISAQLEINVQDNGRFTQEQQSSMRLQMDMPEGDIYEYRAVRIGPALTRLTFVSQLEDDEQVCGREYVFNPTPLNVLDQKDEEGYACDIDGNYNRLYPPPLHLLHDPQYKTYSADGLHPGDDALERLSHSVTQAGFIYQQRSTEHYQLIWQDGDTDRTDNAVYIYVLIKDGDQERLNAIFTEFNSTLEHPLVWPELAEALGDKLLLEQQIKISEKYGI